MNLSDSSSDSDTSSSSQPSDQVKVDKDDTVKRKKKNKDDAAKKRKSIEKRKKKKKKLRDDEETDTKKSVSHMKHNVDCAKWGCKCKMKYVKQESTVEIRKPQPKPIYIPPHHSIARIQTMFPKLYKWDQEMR